MILDWIRGLKKKTESEFSSVLTVDGEEIVSKIEQDFPRHPVLLTYDQYRAACYDVGKRPMTLETWNKIRFGSSCKIPDGAW